mmetsp:Transcript_49936/g.139838  ORF Transcript_49936/g.139838 Transcript_49936/m.139838 type:complete len:301 (-) Transcript_49936:44-946(-)
MSFGGGGPGYFAGNDGNSNSGRADNNNSFILQDRPNLDSGWSFTQQFAALARSAITEDDRTFKESSVKDVTDKGRAQGSAKLHAALVEVCAKAPKARRKPSAGAVLDAAPGERLLPLKDLDGLTDAELRTEVGALCRRLQQFRADGPSRANEENAASVLLELERLPVTVRCLKATKIAAELNLPFWRSNEIPPGVRDHASALVKRWRTMYRCEEGLPGGASAATHERRCRNLATDLESTLHSHKQRVNEYSELIQGACALLHFDPEATRSLLQGGISAKDFATRALRKTQRALAARQAMR